MISGNRNQKAFLRRVAKKMKSDNGNLDISKEYMKVYPVSSQAVAQAASSRLLNSEMGQKTLAELLEQDFPRSKRSERLKELATATKDHVLQDGTIVSIRDNQSSLRSLELIAKVTGDVRESGTVIDARSVHYTINLDEAAKLAELADRLERLENDGTAPKPSVPALPIVDDGAE